MKGDWIRKNYSYFMGLSMILFLLLFINSAFAEDQLWLDGTLDEFRIYPDLEWVLPDDDWRYIAISFDGKERIIQTNVETNEQLAELLEKYDTGVKLVDNWTSPNKELSSDTILYFGDFEKVELDMWGEPLVINYTKPDPIPDSRLHMATNYEYRIMEINCSPVALYTDKLCSINPPQDNFLKMLMAFGILAWLGVTLTYLIPDPKVIKK